MRTSLSLVNLKMLLCDQGAASRNKGSEELIGGKGRVMIIAMRREKREERREKGVYCIGGSNEAECVSNTPKLNQDQMRQLYQQLSMMFQPNTQSNIYKASSSMCVNLIQNSLNTSWILDSGANDHMTGDEKSFEQL
jgi:hypothetical protein